MNTSNLESPVLLDKSRNSNCIVVTSDVLLSGDHFGACARPVLKLISEYGIPESVLKQGNNLSPKSRYKQIQLLYKEKCKYV